MTGPNDRRGFLRGLASLPLIGGGVALIGRPTAADVPVTRALLDAYDEFLEVERRFLKWERFGMAGMEAFDRAEVDVVYRNRRTGRCFDYHPCNSFSGVMHDRKSDSPAARAAIVLSAVGCDWSQA